VEEKERVVVVSGLNGHGRGVCCNNVRDSTSTPVRWVEEYERVKMSVLAHGGVHEGGRMVALHSVLAHGGALNESLIRYMLENAKMCYKRM